MRICLFEEGRTAALTPLALLQPVFDLPCGITTLQAKQEHAFGPDSLGLLVRPLLEAVTRETHPDRPVNAPHWLRSGPTIMVNGRWIPPLRHDISLPTTQELFADGPFVAICHGEVAFATLTAEMLAAVRPNVIDDCIHDWLQELPQQDVGGTMVRTAHDLIDHNPTQLVADFATYVKDRAEGHHHAGMQLIGPRDQLFIDPTARIDPYVVIDTTTGPVFIDSHVVIEAFTRIAGPCFIGSQTRLQQATIRDGCSFGIGCEIRGTVSQSIIQCGTEVQGSGSITQSLIGRQVRIGAGVHVATGTVIGDHARIDSGVLLAEYASIGLNAQVQPTGHLVPNVVPAFHIVLPDGCVEPSYSRTLSLNLSDAQDELFQSRASQLPITPRIRRVA